MIMIFYLTNSLRLKEEDSIYIIRYKRCIRNIANAAIEGSHILRGDFEILCDCIDLFKGDDEFEMFFRDLVNNYSIRTIPPEITFYIEVVKEDPIERIENECVISQKSINDFYLSTSLLCCHLICEDENDCEFYEFITKWFIKDEQLNYNIKVKKIGGGGDRTVYKVKEFINDGLICFCIVDSDRKFPEMSINKNSIKCQKLERKSCGYKCVVLSVNEIENILPLNYINEIITTDKKYKWGKSQLQKKHFDYLCNSDKNIEILKYFDYKNGIKKNSCLLDDIHYKNFAKLCWEQNPDISSDCTFEEYIERLSDKESIYMKLSESISADVLNYIKSNQAKGSLIKPKLLSFQKEEWNKIAKNLLNWSCARIPEGLS